MRAKNETVTSTLARQLHRWCKTLWMLWVAFFVFTVAQAEAQQIDRFSKSRYPAAFPLTWENVTDSGQFVDGQKPTPSGERLVHVVELAPGQHTDFLLEPHELIRALAADTPSIDAEDCELWLSDGSGLMRKLNPARTSDGLSFIAAPDYPLSLIHI